MIPASYNPDTVRIIRARAAAGESAMSIGLALGWSADRVIRVGRYHGADIAEIEQKTPSIITAGDDSKPVCDLPKTVRRVYGQRADQILREVDGHQVSMTPSAARALDFLKYHKVNAQVAPRLAERASVSVSQVHSWIITLRESLGRAKCLTIVQSARGVGYWLERRAPATRHEGLALDHASAAE